MFTFIPFKFLMFNQPILYFLKAGNILGLTKKSSNNSSNTSTKSLPLSIGIETMQGVMKVILKRKSTIPAKRSVLVSTARHDQDNILVKVNLLSNLLLKNLLLFTKNLSKISFSSSLKT